MMKWHSPWSVRSRFWLEPQRSEQFARRCSCDIQMTWRLYETETAGRAMTSLMTRAVTMQSWLHLARHRGLAHRPVHTASRFVLLYPPARHVVQQTTLALYHIIILHTNFTHFNKVVLLLSTHVDDMRWLASLFMILSVCLSVCPKRLKLQSSNLPQGKSITSPRQPINIRSKGQRSRSQRHKAQNILKAIEWPKWVYLVENAVQSARDVDVTERLSCRTVHHGDDSPHRRRLVTHWLTTGHIAYIPAAEHHWNDRRVYVRLVASATRHVRRPTRSVMATTTTNNSTTSLLHGMYGWQWRLLRLAYITPPGHNPWVRTPPCQWQGRTKPQDITACRIRTQCTMSFSVTGKGVLPAASEPCPVTGGGYVRSPTVTSRRIVYMSHNSHWVV